MCDAAIVKDFEHRITLLETFRDELLAKIKQINTSESSSDGQDLLTQRQAWQKQREEVLLQAQTIGTKIGQEIPFKVEERVNADSHSS